MLEKPKNIDGTPIEEENKDDESGLIVDEKGNVETKRGWEHELKRRDEDPNWWREQE